MINFIQTSFSSNIDSFYINKLFREISESLNLPINRDYHTGIRRDEDQVWRRSSDGAEVHLEGWYAGYPSSNASHDFLYWSYFNGSNEKAIINSYGDYPHLFICEY